MPSASGTSLKGLPGNPKGYHTGDRCDPHSDLNLQTISEEGVQYCESTWDSFLCWPAAPVGHVLSQVCPKLAVTSKVLNASKECTLNGTWSLTNFDTCMTDDFPEHPLDDHVFHDYSLGINVIYHIGYSITIIALIIALTIFWYFRSLRCLRNIIHCNLLCAFLLNSVGWLVLHNTVMKIYLTHPTLCSLIVIVVYHLHSIPFYWMFIEGLYLFTIIAWAFTASRIKLWYYLVLGWGVPFIPTAAWAAVKWNILNTESCLLTSDIRYDLIINLPVLILLLLNVFFIIAIIWVLVTKLRASNTLETRQSRKATRATVVLFPLLGVTYIFFLKAPMHSRDVNLTFGYINTVLQSFQGLFVAMIYCFWNGEVRSLVRLKLSAIQDSRSLSRYTRSSFFGSPRRSSCYAMANTNCNGRHAGGGGGAAGATSIVLSGSGCNLALAADGSRVPPVEEATVMVVCGDGPTQPCSNGDGGQRTKVLRTSAEETEGNHGTYRFCRLTPMITSGTYRAHIGTL
ncbi:corticotropin-releasing factor receptor 1-like [Elysia marginata]|uniref:Corticotropin-releasing factor receptor 1-like n=1 Tax=Elysia marginata TaxID=1093978 RepID=A0AAV4GXG4_9GAST|nr:corticotropin-releasing factor receptor 1-like [Elysia marginata]